MKQREEKGILRDRCSQIRGDGQLPCFIRNKNQIECISDIVINKACAVKMLVESAREDGCDIEILDAVSMVVDDLINWIRYLQEGGDMYVSKI